jgi:hypothetical protein
MEMRTVVELGYWHPETLTAITNKLMHGSHKVDINIQ